MVATTNIPLVVTMGGGTGTFSVISALKTLPVEISSIVAVSDSGGSTGRIRDEFGFQPVGDLRQSLAALADPEGQEWIQKILLYRFDKGSGLKGHNLGNLILTALQDMTDTTTQALEIAEQIFDLSGSVIPVTTQNVELTIHYLDGTQAVGEHILDERTTDPKKIDRVSLQPPGPLNPKAISALHKASLVVIGPGDYYASLMATLVVENLKGTFQKIDAKIMYVSNLMTRRTQTHNMTLTEHLTGIEQAIGKAVDFVLINNQPIPQHIVDHYKTEEEYPVIDDLPTSDTRAIRAPVISTTVVKKAKSDTAHRSLLRHDPQKLTLVLEKIFKRQLI